MPDTIALSHIELWTRIGVLEEERRNEQCIRVTVELSLNTRAAGTSDDIGKTIDYDAVARAVRALGKTERKTLEKLAEDIAAMLLNDFHPESVTVTVGKRIIPGMKEASVTIRRP